MPSESSKSRRIRCGCTLLSAADAGNDNKNTGWSDVRQMSISHVERQNLTMRMAIRRFTRPTNAFSKQLDNLRAACAGLPVHYIPPITIFTGHTRRFA